MCEEEETEIDEELSIDDETDKAELAFLQAKTAQVDVETLRTLAGDGYGVGNTIDLIIESIKSRYTNQTTKGEQENV